MIPDDLAMIDAALAPLWPRLDGARILFTGGTGFIGRWMIEALARAPICAEVTILSRDPGAFAARAPHLADRYAFVAGNILHFAPPAGPFTHVIHGATDASAALNANAPLAMFDTIVEGTRHVLGLSRQWNARLLMMSSGAVYGVQPASLPHVPEEWTGAPDPCDPRSAYGAGKRAAEMLCTIHARQFGIDIVTARIFALLGPLLPLDTHFAAGNFIRDAMAGRPIRVLGSGRAVRSYLYAADLCIWMWTLAIAGPAGSTYNVGSEHGVSIAELAECTARVLNAPGVEILGQDDPGWNPGRYVPSTGAIRHALNLGATIDLDTAIRRTAIANGWTP